MKSSSESMLRVVVVGVTILDPFFLSERGQSSTISSFSCLVVVEDAWDEDWISSAGTLRSSSRGVLLECWPCPVAWIWSRS